MRPSVLRRRLLAGAAAAGLCSLLAPSRASSLVEYFRAIDTDNASIVADLLRRGIDPNSVDERGNVGLFLALRVESLKVAEVLLAHPALKVDATNPPGETALMMAALRGQRVWVEKLLAKGAALNREGWTPLHYAASGPSAEVTQLLLERGALIDAVSPTGASALMMAVRFGSEDSAQVLLARGANVRHRDAQGRGAVEFARLAGRDALAQRLDALLR